MKSSTEGSLKDRAKVLVRARDTIVKYRMSLASILRSYQNNQVPQRIIDSYLAIIRQERELNREFSEFVEAVPILSSFTSVHGVGDVVAVTLFSEVDIHRADTVSSLWRYCGMGVLDGKAEKYRKGSRASYSRRMKSLCYQVGASFLRTKSPYCWIYNSAKKEYISRGWPRMRAHLAATRKMVKIWLSHVWEVWRTYEGLDVCGPYSHPKNKFEPIDFGWEQPRFCRDPESGATSQKKGEISNDSRRGNPIRDS